MIYLDNAATTLPKPPQVAEAIANALNTLGNPARGSYDASLDALRCLMRARMEVASLFNVPEALNVAFTLNATAALNIAISSLKGHVLTTASSHNSVLRPLYRRGDFSVVPTDEKGVLHLDELDKAFTKDTTALVISHASNLTGNVVDLAAVSEICAKHDARLIVDAAQTAGLLPIDMKKLNVSALCFSGHKSLYGPQGTGGICIANGFLPDPFVVGGSGSESFSKTQPASMPDRLEAGTQNAHGIAGLLAGIRYVKSLGGRAFADADRLARRFYDELKNVNGVRFYGDMEAKLRTPVVAINVIGRDGGDVADILWTKFGIAVRAGAHCSPLMHEALNTQNKSAVRFSFSHMNTDEDVNAAVTAVQNIVSGGI